MQLIHPETEHIAEIAAFRQEFIDCQDILHGTGQLAKFSSIEKWLTTIHKNNGQQTQFLIVGKDDRRLIGMLHVQHRLSEFDTQWGGHIRYCIRNSERGKGFAQKALIASLDYCQDIGLKRVLLTCNSENKPSARVIESCGGKLENTIRLNRKNIKRYWIPLNEKEKTCL